MTDLEEYEQRILMPAVRILAAAHKLAVQRRLIELLRQRGLPKPPDPA